MIILAELSHSWLTGANMVNSVFEFVTRELCQRPYALTHRPPEQNSVILNEVKDLVCGWDPSLRSG